MSDDLLLLFPGEETPSLRLTDLLRDAHDEASEARAKEVERRQKSGIPMDDETDWSAVSAVASKLVAAVDKKDSAAVRAIASDVTDAVALPIAKLDPFQERPSLSQVRVKLKTMSSIDRSKLDGKTVAAGAAFQREIEKGAGADIARMEEINRQALEAQIEYVRASVVEISGLRRVSLATGESEAMTIRDLSDQVVDGLNRVGLLGLLFQVCQRFQRLPPGKAARSGSLPQST